jgi:hypothetical protein
MRFSKALGLAVLAVMAAMAFVGGGTASADSEMVLCTALVEKASELCPPNTYLKQGTTISALASAPAILLPGAPAVKCEDGIIEGGLGTTMAAELTVTVTEIAFGKLPTPALGAGCTVCTQGIHVTPLPTGAWFGVEAGDAFFFKLEGVKIVLKGCPLGITCEYITGGFKSPIDRHAQEHPDWPEKKKDVILVKRVLTTVGGSPFCPKGAEWFGEYILTLSRVEPKEGPHLFYVALEQL